MERAPAVGLERAPAVGLERAPAVGLERAASTLEILGGPCRCPRPSCSCACTPSLRVGGPLSFGSWSFGSIMSTDVERAKKKVEGSSAAPKRTAPPTGSEPDEPLRRIVPEAGPPSTLARARTTVCANKSDPGSGTLPPPPPSPPSPPPSSPLDPPASVARSRDASVISRLTDGRGDVRGDWQGEVEPCSGRAAKCSGTTCVIRYCRSGRRRGARLARCRRRKR